MASEFVEDNNLLDPILLDHAPKLACTAMQWYLRRYELIFLLKTVYVNGAGFDYLVICR